MNLRRVIICFGAFVLVLLSLYGLHEFAQSSRLQVFGKLVDRVDTSDKVVALTFDDGPTPGILDDLLSTLASRDVHATFFVVGNELAAFPDGGHRLIAAGHELANHTYSHQRMVLKSPGFVQQEIERTDALIRASGQEGEIYFRPPFGYKMIGLPWYLWRTGRTTVMWDINPEPDGGNAPSSEQIVTTTLQRVQPGSIILLHLWYSGGGTSRGALPMLIDRLKEEGYRFVTVSELLHESPPANMGKTDSDPHP